MYHSNYKERQALVELLDQVLYSEDDCDGKERHERVHFEGDMMVMHISVLREIYDKLVRLP